MSPGEQLQATIEAAFAAMHTTRGVVLEASPGPDEGGPPLPRILAWPKNTPMPHWHVVTCGLSASTVIAGYPDLGGFELTLKLPRAPSDAAPPAWLAPFLQALARDAFRDEGPLSNEFLEFPPAAYDPPPGAGVLFDDDEAPAGLKLRRLIVVSRADGQRLRRETDLAERKALALELCPAGISDLARASRPPEPAPPPPARAAQTLESLAVDEGPPITLRVDGADAHALAQAIRSASTSGTRVTLTGGRWTLLLNVTFVDDTARSATSDTAVALFLPFALANEVASSLEDRRRDAQPRRWPELPGFVVQVSDSPAAGTVATAPVTSPKTDFAPFTTLAITKGAPMQVSIAPDEAATLGQALRAAIMSGRITLTGGGWTLMLTVESPPRSATWATTLAVYLTVDLAKQLAEALGDRAGDGQVRRWAELPDLALLVSAARSSGATPSAGPQPLLSRLKRFFGG